ncbi:uncharacterized protein [Nicotiana sylvestris]|uniref:uncharacterized protein n=1 Tax=Nicotiana sylvestris TaxID=4096 RepID=UPI00388CCAA6
MCIDAGGESYCNASQQLTIHEKNYNRDLNLRQRRCLELLKDYEITILYHPGKANMVADALHKKVESMGNLAYISVEERPLGLDVQSLANRPVRLDISELSRILTCVVAQYSLLGQIKAWQFDDLYLAVLRETMLQGSAKEVSIERLAQIYIREIVQLHGVPVTIISDRGPQFTSHFWRAIQSELGTRVELSTSFHPQTDGQSKRIFQIPEDMLRACVIYFGGQWDQFLPLAEFAYYNSYQSSIKMAPFEALYGR